MQEDPQPENLQSESEPITSTQAPNPVLFADGRLRSIWRFVLAVVLLIAANFAGGAISQVIFAGHPVAFDAGYRLFTTLLMVGGFALMLRYLDRAEGSLLEAQGLGFRRKWVREFAIGAALGFVLISIAVAAIAVWGDLDIAVKLNAITVRHSITVLVLLVAGAALEEVMFRGYPFQRLVESIGAWGAIVVFSVMFGAVHLGNPNAGGIRSWGFFNTIAVGVLFAWAYLKTGSLWLPIGIHFAWNCALGFVYGLPVSGLQVFATIVRSKAIGPKLLTGGAYGIEASVTGAVVIVLGMGILWAMPKRMFEAGPVGGSPPEDISVQTPEIGI